MSKKFVLFDLDGTLTDSSQGIIESLEYMIQKQHLEKLDAATLRSFIGPPLIDSLMETYGLQSNTARQAVNVYRGHFKEYGLMKLTLYPKIESVLQALSREYTLGIATSKTEEFACEILENLSLAHYFAGIFGADPEVNRENKTKVIAYALKELMAQPAEVVMIGDRKYDIVGAKENGLSSLGVSYGFGSPEELLAAGADQVVAQVEDIPRALATFK